MTMKEKYSISCNKKAICNIYTSSTTYDNEAGIVYPTKKAVYYKFTSSTMTMKERYISYNKQAICYKFTSSTTYDN